VAWPHRTRKIDGIDEGRVEHPTRLPLLPSQAWFFEDLAPRLTHPGDWSHAYLAQLPDDVRMDCLTAALQDLWDTHPALRVTFRAEAGGVQQHLPAVAGAAPVSVVRLGAVPADERDARLDDFMLRGRRLPDLATGPLARFIVLLGEGNGPDLLFLCVHELLADGISFTILLADVEVFYRRRCGERGPALSRRAPFEDCVRRLAAYACSPTVLTQLAYWRNLPWHELAAVPARDGDAMLSGEVVTDLDAAVSDDVASLVAPVLGVIAEDVVIAAVAEAVTTAIGGPVCAELVHNGRTLRGQPEGRRPAPLFHPTVVRTVGLFATSRITLIPHPRGREPAEYVRAVARRLHEAPNDGADYALLRYQTAADEMRQVDAIKGTPQLYLNYLVGEAYRAPAGVRFRRADRLPPPRREPSFPPPLVAVTVRPWRGWFTLHWQYDGRRWTPDRAQAVAGRTTELLTAILPRVAREVRG
jgi:Condensation domain